VGHLAPDEIGRAWRLTGARSRMKYVRGRAALRAILAAQLGVGPREVRLRFGPNGKPTLAVEGAAPSFSVSHAGEWTVIAVGAPGPLGVDVEDTGQSLDVAGLALRFLPDVDLGRIPPAERHLAFFASWTRYEALLKAADARLGASLPSRSRTWAVVRLAAPSGYVATLVTAQPPAQVIERWDPTELPLG
jgi:4'-phosphopantetheinyl transferase